MQNKERLDALGGEVGELKMQMETERAKMMAVEGDNRRLAVRCSQLEEGLRQEKERVIGKERLLEESRRDKEMTERVWEERLAEKQRELDNVKRGFDELQYEGENMRRLINQKQEEIAGLNRMIS